MKIQKEKTQYQQEDLGWAALNSQATIIFANTYFNAFCATFTESAGKSIFDLIPETVGLEFFFEQNSLSSQKTFRLDYINRTSQENGISYFNIV